MNKVFLYFLAALWILLAVMWLEESWTVREYFLYAIALTAIVFAGIFTFNWKPPVKY
jgi:hypothetical protein